MSPRDAVDLEWPLSVGMQVSAQQPSWMAMIIFCWNVKLLKLPSVTLTRVCGTNSHNWWTKGLPGVGVLKFFATPTPQVENPSEYDSSTPTPQPWLWDKLIWSKLVAAAKSEGLFYPELMSQGVFISCWDLFLSLQTFSWHKQSQSANRRSAQSRIFFRIIFTDFRYSRPNSLQLSRPGSGSSISSKYFGRKRSFATKRTLGIPKLLKCINKPQQERSRSHGINKHSPEAGAGAMLTKTESSGGGAKSFLQELRSPSAKYCRNSQHPQLTMWSKPNVGTFFPVKLTRNCFNLKPFKDRKATIVAQTLASHNLPTKRASELIKPATDSASLRLEIEKSFRLGFWVLCVLRHNESMLGQF